MRVNDAVRQEYTRMKLFWFLKAQHADGFLADGKMYFGHCSRYDDERLTPAQRDSEAKRTARFDRTEMRLRTGRTAADAVEVPFTSVEFASTLPTYFLRSLSTEFRPAMLGEFGHDAVIEIFDVPKLIAAVEDAVSKQLNTGSWRLVRKTVEYVSKHELIQTYSAIDRMFTKDASCYGTQAEFRLVLIPEHPFPGASDSHLFLFLDGVAQFAKRLV